MFMSTLEECKLISDQKVKSNTYTMAFQRFLATKNNNNNNNDNKVV